MRSWVWYFEPGVRLGDGVENVTWLDIEARKVPVGDRSSFPYKRRWQPFMVGLGYIEHVGALVVEVFAGTEEEIISYLTDSFEDNGPSEIRYQATREYDEMILRGRFTNARRAHTPGPTGEWPVFDPPRVTWTNQRKVQRPLRFGRAVDLPRGEKIPVYWDRDGERDMVALHCARDVAHNILTDPTIPIVGDLERWMLTHPPGAFEGVERS